MSKGYLSGYSSYIYSSYALLGFTFLYLCVFKYKYFEKEYMYMKISITSQNLDSLDFQVYSVYCIFVCLNFGDNWDNDYNLLFKKRDLFVFSVSALSLSHAFQITLLFDCQPMIVDPSRLPLTGKFSTCNIFFI